MVITVGKNNNTILSDYKKMMTFLIPKEDTSEIQGEIFNYISANCLELRQGKVLDSVLYQNKTIPDFDGVKLVNVKFRYNLISNQLILIEITPNKYKDKQMIRKSMYDVDVDLKITPVELSDIFRNKNVSEILSNAITNHIIDIGANIPFPLSDREDDVDDFIESLYDTPAYIRQSILQEVKKNTHGWNIFRKVSEKLNL